MRKVQKGPTRKWVMPAVSLVLWMVVSSAVILLNKQILVEDGYSYPLTLSALGQFASAIAGKLPNPPYLLLARWWPEMPLDMSECKASAIQCHIQNWKELGRALCIAGPAVFRHKEHTPKVSA